jgi:hypothetical protein
MSEDKQIKLKFVVDNQSVMEARRTLQDLTRELTRFTETLRSASISNAIGGAGARGQQPQGGGNSGLLGGDTSKVGAGGITNLISSPLKALSGMFAGLGQSAKGVKDLTSTLKTSIASQKTDLDSLREAVDKTTASFSRLGNAQQRFAGGGGSPVAMGATSGTGAPGTTYSYSGYGGSAGGGAGFAGAGPAGGSIAAGAGNGGNTSSAGPSSGGGKGSRAPGLAGAFGALAGSPMGMAVMAVTAGALITQDYTGMVQHNNMLNTSAAAERASVMSGTWGRMQKDRDISEVYVQRETEKARKALLSGEADFGVGGLSVSGHLGGGNVNTAKRYAGAVLDAIPKLATFQFGSAWQGLKEAGDETLATTSMLAMTEEQRQQVRTSNQVPIYYQQKAQEESAAKLSWMHATGQDYEYDRKGGGPITDRIGNLWDSLHEKGFTEGEYMGAFGGVRGAGGRRAANALATGSMYGVASGIDNAGQIAGLSAVSGGMKSQFMSYLYGRQGGPGGFDPSALNNIGGYIAGQGTAGGIASSGVGTFNAMMSGSAGGTNGPSDMLTARNMQAGLGQLDKDFGGGLDKFQSGWNVLNASKILGKGASAYNVDYFANKMTSTQLMDIARGGKIDPSLAARGITIDKATAMIRATEESNWMRYKGNDSVVAAYRASGMNMSDFINSSKDRESTRAHLGNALADTQGADAGAGAAIVDYYAGLDRKGGRRSGARGVAGGKSNEVRTAAEQAAMNVEARINTLLGGNQNAADAKDLKTLADSAAKGVSDESRSLANNTLSLKELTIAVLTLNRNMRGGGKPTGIKAGAK